MTDNELESFFYQLSTTKYNILYSSYDNLDSKIHTMINTNLTILTLIMGIGYVLLDKSLSGFSFVFFIASIIMFTFTSILGIVNHIP